jgi:peptidoglycan/LPS O-acetylase OafA/YrhL
MSNSALDAAGSPLAAPVASPSDARAGNEHVVDAMRGVAALLVAYFHCRQVTWVGMQNFHQAVGTSSLSWNAIVGYLTFPVAWGSAGVPVFFVISGYCIHRSSALRLAANPAYRLDTANFWARRFARIYPVLLAALLLTFALDWISFQLPPASHKLGDIGLRTFLVNLFSLQGVAGKTYGSNGALWTLSLEVQFYAVYPLLFALRRRLGMNVVLALVAVVNLASVYVFERHDLQFFTSYWFSWTLGAWLADARVRVKPGDASASWTWQPKLIAAVLAVSGCVAFHFGQYGAFQLWALGFAFYLYKALDDRKTGTPTLRFLARFGDFSFSLYIIHLPIFVLLDSVFFRSSLQLSIWPSIGFLLAALPVAYVFHRLVELPAMRWSASFKSRPTRGTAQAQPL